MEGLWAALGGLVASGAIYIKHRIDKKIVALSEAASAERQSRYAEMSTLQVGVVDALLDLMGEVPGETAAMVTNAIEARFVKEALDKRFEPLKKVLCDQCRQRLVEEGLSDG
jgi:hypothetical protein